MKSLEEETKQILKSNNLYANKKLGQNFLINQDIIENIVLGAEVNENDVVIEIGPGLGALTAELIKKAGRVVCIELDTNMIKVLEKRFCKNQKFRLIHGDVLKTDLKNIIKEEKAQHQLKQAKVVANLPYYITTPIIMKLLEEKLDIASITVMVQKEVAQRLTAKPGEEFTGAITYAISYYSQPSIIIDVPKENFLPAPEVDSAVMQLKILDKPVVEVKDEKFLFEIIKQSFMQKRKTLVNSLSSGGNISKEKIHEILNELGLDEKIRAEKLTLEQFSKIADFIRI